MSGAGWTRLYSDAPRAARTADGGVRGRRALAGTSSSTIRIAGDAVRHGQVLEVDRDLAVMEVFEGTAGMSTSAHPGVSSRANRSGLPVGDGWLGRVCNGRGEAIDGGPPVVGRPPRDGRRGSPQPGLRAIRPPTRFITGVSVIDALTTLVRGQKLPVFSLPGMPHLSLACSDRRASDSERRAVLRGLRGYGHDSCRRRVRPRRARRTSAAGELVLLLNTADDPVIERMLTPRIALTIAEHLAFERRSPRARRDG